MGPFIGLGLGLDGVGDGDNVLWPIKQAERFRDPLAQRGQRGPREKRGDHAHLW